jgi:hypothetical protein
MAKRDTLPNISRSMHLGVTFEREGKLSEARWSFNEALANAERAQQYALVFQASEALAAVEVRAKNLARAREHLHKCLEIRLSRALFTQPLINLVGLEREDRQFVRAFVLGAVAYGPEIATG